MVKQCLPGTKKMIQLMQLESNLLKKEMLNEIIASNEFNSFIVLKKVITDNKIGWKCWDDKNKYKEWSRWMMNYSRFSNTYSYLLYRDLREAGLDNTFPNNEDIRNTSGLRVSLMIAIKNWEKEKSKKRKLLLSVQTKEAEARKQKNLIFTIIGFIAIFIFGVFIGLRKKHLTSSREHQ